MSLSPRLLDVLLRYEELIEQGRPVTPEELCRDCPDLLPEVRHRLQGLQALDPILRVGGVSDTPPDDDTEQPSPPDAGALAAVRSQKGTPITIRVPGYEIQRELGRGGMGVVYQAVQLGFNRPVALKMILSGEFASEQDVKRFLSEAESVAKLRHPNVVQVYDFGQHQGRPYFSMEFLEGGSLAGRMSGEPMPPVEAAEIVRKLAGAVEHAHRAGIVHRDLKPANVLLDADGEPKVADFGTAKTGGSELTGTGAVMGTPRYMSPEQASGKAKEVGPATDVWALGVILYELITGRAPFRGSDPLHTMLLVKNQEPVSPRLLQPKLAKDLETICLKCLRKSPGQRYPTAKELADDLGRYLENRPIAARPAGRLEHAARWVRRNPGLAAAVAVVAVTLLVSSVLSTWFALRANRDRKSAELARQQESERADAERDAKRDAQAARELADRRAKEAGQFADFFEGLFQSYDPTGISGYGFRPSSKTTEEIPAVELLERGADRLTQDLEGNPAAQARLMTLIAGVRRSRGEFGRARELLDQSLAICRDLPPGNETILAGAYAGMGWLEHDWGDYAKAEEYLRKAIGLYRAGGEELKLALTVAKLGWVFVDELNPDAESHIREALELRKARLPAGHRDIAVIELGLAAWYFRNDDTLRAVPLLTEAVGKLADLPGGEQIERAVTAFQSGMTWYALGRYARAEPRFRECLEYGEKFLGSSHPYLALPYAQIALMYEDAENPEAAERNYLRAIDLLRGTFGLAHPRSVDALWLYLTFLNRQGRLKDVEQLLAEAVQAGVERYGDGHENLASPRLAYAAVLANDKRLGLAERYAEEALAVLPEGRPARHRNAPLDLSLVAGELKASDRTDLLERLHRRAITEFRHHDPDTIDFPGALKKYAEFLWREGRFEDVRIAMSEAVGVCRTPGHPAADQLNEMLNGLGQTEMALGNVREAEAILREALAFGRRRPSPRSDGEFATVRLLAKLLHDRGDAAAAAGLLDENRGWLSGRKDFPRDRVAYLLWLSATCRVAAGDREAADLLGAEALTMLQEEAARLDVAARRNLVAVCFFAEGVDAAELLALADEADGHARGIALLKAGKAKEAAEAFGRPQQLRAALCGILARFEFDADASRKAHTRILEWLDRPSENDPKKTNREALSWDVGLEAEALLRRIGKLAAGGDDPADRE